MGLHRYWPLDETSGTTALETVSGTNANVIGDPSGNSAVSAKFGYGRDFSLGDGGTSYLQLWPGTVDTTEYTQWSLSCWFRRDSTTGGDWLYLFNIGDASNGSNGQESVLVYFYNQEIFVDLRNASNSLWDRVSHAATYFGNGWHHFCVTCDGSDTRLYIDGALVDTATGVVALMPDTDDSYFNYNTFHGVGDVFADDLAIFTSALSADDVSTLWNGGTGTTVASLTTTTADILVPSPLGAPRIYAINDWSGTVPRSAQIYYRGELRSGSTVLKLPISSWQATLQSGRSSYLQCVVPAAESYIDDITTLYDAPGTTLVVVRGALRSDGSVSELDMASVPLEQIPYQRGAQRSTVTLSGYGTIEFDVVDAESPPSGSVRELSGVQTISADTTGTRARSEVDWLLKPGMIADAEGTTFQVSYINYYANAAQEFMDCGSRPL